MVERYSFVAITAADLVLARHFWVDQLGFTVIEETEGSHFIVDAGGLRLCVDIADGDVHRAGGGDPVIGLKVDSVVKTLAALGIVADIKDTDRGAYAELRDPDGHVVILSEGD
jgi:catechol 2,3-dioxygenase-like lactoylglutathione lyase family enzyme